VKIELLQGFQDVIKSPETSPALGIAAVQHAESLLC
jgi:hypothetical protein